MTHSDYNAPVITDHRPLLGQVEGGSDKCLLNIIFVVHGRTPERLCGAMGVAKATNSRLVILCDDGTQAQAARNYCVYNGLPDAISVDSSKFRKHACLQQTAASHPQAIAAPKYVKIAYQRNVALRIARMTGSKAMFLDDDIFGLTPAMLDTALSALSTCPMAGFASQDFPDLSVLEHALALLGEKGSTFVSNSAMLFDGAAIESHCPPIYNEDWFLYSQVGLGSIAFCGEVGQLPYDPFIPRRAISEVFGSIAIAVSMQTDPFDTPPEVWTTAITERAWRVKDTIRRLGYGSDPAAQQARETLATTLPILETLAAYDFVSFMEQWQRDIAHWHRTSPPLGQFEIEEALDFLAGRQTSPQDTTASNLSPNPT
jgi:hypothetical protein